MSDDKPEKIIPLIPGECAITIVPNDGYVVMVAKPPLAAVPLEPNQARDIARRLRQCADRVEAMQRMSPKKDQN